MVWSPGLDCKVGGNDAIQLGKGLTVSLTCLVTLSFVGVETEELHGKGPSDSLMYQW